MKTAEQQAYEVWQSTPAGRDFDYPRSAFRHAWKAAREQAMEDVRAVTAHSAEPPCALPDEFETWAQFSAFEGAYAAYVDATPKGQFHMPRRLFSIGWDACAAAIAALGKEPK